MRSEYGYGFSGGHSIAEYALLLFLLVLVSIPALQIMGQALEAFYSESQPVSRAGELFALLDGSAPAPTNGQAADVGTPASDSAATPAATAVEVNTVTGDNQPVEDVALEFDGGRVQVMNGSGELSTSAEGTRILAQNLREVVEENAPYMTEEQKKVVTRLADLGDSIAGEEEYLVNRYPGIESTNPPNIVAFSDTNTRRGAGRSEYLHADYLAFKDEYASLEKAFGQNQGNPVLNAAKKEIDANAGTISQLAYHNFLKPQADIDTHRKGEIDSNKVAAGVDVTKCRVKKTQTDDSTAYVGTKTDISGISVEQSPVVTYESAAVIRQQERKSWWNQVK